MTFQVHKTLCQVKINTQRGYFCLPVSHGGGGNGVRSLPVQAKQHGIHTAAAAGTFTPLAGWLHSDDWKITNNALEMRHYPLIKPKQVSYPTLKYFDWMLYTCHLKHSHKFLFNAKMSVACKINRQKHSNTSNLINIHKHYLYNLKHFGGWFSFRGGVWNRTN